MVRRLVICLALLLGACNSPESDTIIFALANAPGMLDPRLAGDAASERANALLYDRLVRLDEHGLPQPAMADWQVLDATRYRVTLRADRATFWNGEKPVAADVVATYRSLLDPALGSPHAGALAHIDRVEALSDVEIAFTLSRPDPRFASRLTVGILPAAQIGTTNFSAAPHGSGRFAMVGWGKDGGLLLRRRRDGQRIALVAVADPTMRALKLLRAEAQLVQNDLPSELYAYLEGRPGLQLSTRPGSTFAYIGFNLADPVLSNRDVRAAVAHAIDREAIINYLFGGRARLAESVLRPEHWAAAVDLEPYAYSPERARALLERAGYGPDRPLVLSYKTSADPFRLRIAHVFQDQLAAVGIELRISSYDWGTFFGDIKAGRFQMYSLAWVGVNTPDILRYAFHSTSLPPSGANRGHYVSAEVDDLIRQADLSEPSTAAALYRAIQRQVHHDLVYVPLWYEANVAVSHGIDGYRPRYDGSYLALNDVRKVPLAE